MKLIFTFNMLVSVCDTLFMSVYVSVCVIVFVSE